jgi:nucleoside 2-deoxyribosyltransferase
LSATTATPTPRIPRIYLCGPITGDDRDQDWRAEAADMIRRAGCEALSPLRGKDMGKVAREGLDYEGGPLAGHWVDRDKQDVVGADAVLCVIPGLPQSRPSIGTFVEWGWAAAHAIPIVVCTEIPTVHEQGFVHRLATVLQTDGDLERAIAAAIRLAEDHARTRC